MVLDDAQRASLRSLIENNAADAERRRNARIILAYADGADTAAVATACDLSESRTRYWRGVFEKYGMSMFEEGFAPPVRRRAPRERPPASTFTLSDEQRRALAPWLDEAVDDALRGRARLLLAYADGKDTDVIAREVGLSPSRTRYWRKAFEREGMTVFEHAGSDVATSEVHASGNKKSPLPGILPDDCFSEAGRKVLHMYFGEMLAMEAHPDMDGDPEVVHKMRVATRRIRSAFEIFDLAFDDKTKKRFRRPLKRLGRTLGCVRDLDVLLMHMRAYARELSAADASSFAPLLSAWEDDRAMHFAALRAFLADEAYLRFREQFRQFVETPLAGALPDEAVVPGVSRRVAQVAPELILRRYTEVLAFDPRMETASIDLLHRLRIQCKKLRYTMESFTELLGPGGRKAIRQTIVLQDYLGELQDGQAASDMITDFVSGLDARQSSRPMHERLNPAPLLNYLATREAHKHALLLGVGNAWRDFRAADTHKRFLRSLIP
ncbi:MAG: CHAD domain-containing protein [Bacteroidetes bacterium]|nr:CHAD domain-containing protein [Bacteroidota bacterium]